MANDLFLGKILASLDRLEDKIDAKIDTFEKRLDRIEKFQSYMKGIGYTAVGALGFLAAAFINYFL